MLRVCLWAQVYPFGKALGNEAIVDGHDMRGMPAVQHALQKL